MARMLRIHTLLEKGRFPNCQRLASELEVSPKTIQRDIDFMRFQLELPIDYDAVRHGFFYAGAVHKFPALTISEGELTALLVAQKALEQYRGTVFEKPLQSAFTKIASGLPTGVEVSIRSLAQAYSFRPSNPAVADLATFEKLSEAVMGSTEVTFDYKPLGGSEAGRRRIQPYHLRCADNQWYLIGYDQQRGAMRTFALARMARVVDTNRKFVRAAGFSADEMMSGAFGAFEAREIKVVRLKLDSVGSRVVGEREVHPSQVVKKLPNGESQLTLRVGIAPDLVRWILGLGEHVEVLTPLELRRHVREVASAIVKKNV